jgi:hypothetical protein
MNKLKSRKFWLTILSHGVSAYLIYRGSPEAAAAVSSIAQGTYNIGQAQVDAKAKDLDVEAIKDAVFGD